MVSIFIKKTGSTRSTKMMDYVSTHFLKELGDLGDPEANAVATRLGSFVGSKLYRTEPKGRTMPLRDISSQSRA